MSGHEERGRRQNVLVGAGIIVVVLVMAAFAVFILVQEQQGDETAAEGGSMVGDEPVGGPAPATENEPVEGSNKPIPGLMEIENLINPHVEGPVEYEQTPPAGGPHHDSWLNCGVYTEPVPNENAVHSLEHGVVWITYQPELTESEVGRLSDLVTGQNPSVREKLLLSPYESLPVPVVASAWGRQLELTGADDPRLEQFIEAFVSGLQSPEPFATCAGGIGTPDA